MRVIVAPRDRRSSVFASVPAYYVAHETAAADTVSAAVASVRPTAAVGVVVFVVGEERRIAAANKSANAAAPLTYPQDESSK